MEEGWQEEARQRKAGRKMKASVKSKQGQEENENIEEGIRSSQRMALEGQNPIRRWDCSQIENEDEEESWQEGDQLAEQWEEEQHLEETVERRTTEGSSLKLDVTQKVLELVLNKRKSQGGRVKNPTEKKKVPGWSIEEMKERPGMAVEEETEEMNKWRSLNQIGIYLCWKNLAERTEEEVLDKYNVEESKNGAFKARGKEGFQR